MRAGRARWVEQVRARIAAGELARFPVGRKKGSKNRTVEQREQAAADAQGDRDYRRLATATRQRRRARRRAGTEFDTVLTRIEVAFADAHAAGLHLNKADVIALEHDFFYALEAGSLPARVLQRIYYMLCDLEQRIDRGEREDLARRARLEEAYERWKTGLAGSDVRVQNLPKGCPRSPETPPAGRYSASALISPPASQLVDNFVHNTPVEIAEEAALRQALAVNEAVREAARIQARAYATPVRVPDGPRFLRIDRQRPPQ